MGSGVNLQYLFQSEKPAFHNLDCFVSFYHSIISYVVVLELHLISIAVSNKSNDIFLKCLGVWGSMLYFLLLGLILAVYPAALCMRGPI